MDVHMPRISRVVIPDCPHHIIQRGNRRQVIFFIQLLEKKTDRNKADWFAYVMSKDD